MLLKENQPEWISHYEYSDSGKLVPVAKPLGFTPSPTRPFQRLEMEFKQWLAEKR